MEKSTADASRKILIVEDEEAVLRILSETLTEAGFEVFKAMGGEEGIRLAQHEKPDLVLLDILMPKVDGMQVLKTIKTSDWGKDMRVVMLTNLSSMENIQEALENGAKDYLVKADLKIDDLVSKIKLILGESS